MRIFDKNVFEDWGKENPYYAVLTDEKYKKDGLTKESLHDFFDSGCTDLKFVRETLESQFQVKLTPRCGLDFGCGVGRILIPLSKLCEKVYGIDSSTSMLSEAKKNLQSHACKNVTLVEDIGGLNAVKFDFVHSVIVFQHINKKIGLGVFKQILKQMDSHSFGALHFIYSRDKYVNSNGIAKEPSWRLLKRAIKRLLLTYLRRKNSKSNPYMPMNFYDSNQVLFLLQNNGVSDVFLKFTNHGGYYGFIVFFWKR